MEAISLMLLTIIQQSGAHGRYREFRESSSKHNVFGCKSRGPQRGFRILGIFMPNARGNSK